MTGSRPGDTIWDRFRITADQHPHRVAVIEPHGTTSYAALKNRASQLADWLLTTGVQGLETPIAVQMRKSSDLIATLLAISATGSSYIPIHAAHPDSVVQRLLHQAHCQLRVTDEASRHDRELHPSPLVVPAPGGPDTHHVEHQPTGSSTTRALVMYTSGSTGSPKGAELTNADILALVDDHMWDADRYQRVLSLAPYAFGLSSFEFWVVLLHGGTVVIPQHGPLDLNHLRELIHEHDITAAHLTSGLLRVIAEEDPTLVATLREVLTGGDVIPASSLSQLRAASPELWIRALYGQTETTLFALAKTYAPHDPLPAQVVPLGQPLDGMTAQLSDHADEEGRRELLIGGAGVSRGYVGDPEATAQKFYQAADGTRFFRTGDLCRLDSDGELWFAGRADHLIKVRGFRVELGEVEAALLHHPDVTSAVAVAIGDGPDDKRIHAFVTGPTQLDTSDLRRSLRTEIPDYAVPVAITQIDRVPVTANGKTDRPALSATLTSNGTGR